MLCFPTVLSIITTYQCNAICPNCCFQCSPGRSEKLEVYELERLINECNWPTLKLIAFTGGEFFLYGKDLFKLVSLAHRKSRTRIVTNGFWATSIKTTMDNIDKLLENGLDELNISTGDEHSKFVPTKNIQNIIDCAVKKGLSLAINIESHEDAKIKGEDFIASEFNKEAIKNGKLKISAGLWIPREKKFNHIKHSNDKNRHEKETSGCNMLGRIIAINPDGTVVACCGLFAEKIKEMQLGNIREKSLSEILQQAPDDLLKLWLMTEGPEQVLRHIYKKESIEIPPVYHPCEACRYLYSNENIRGELRNMAKQNETEIIKNYIGIISTEFYGEHVRKNLDSPNWI